MSSFWYLIDSQGWSDTVHVITNEQLVEIQLGGREHIILISMEPFQYNDHEQRWTTKYVCIWTLPTSFMYMLLDSTYAFLN